MTGSRDAMLAGIRQAIYPNLVARSDSTAEVDARLSNPQPNLIPARAQLAADAQITLFTKMAEGVSATVERVSSAADIPAAVTRFLAQHNLPSALRLTPDRLLQEAPWSNHPALTVTTGVAEETDRAAIAVAVAGVAETGTLVMRSGPEGPTTNNFLPENHLVVLPADHVVGNYEEVWRQIRGDAEDGLFMPRTVNWITGPSRSGDIEQQIQLGVHGPRRLHILILDETD